MPSRVLVVGCGGWGAAVVGAVKAHHAGLATRHHLGVIDGVRTESGVSVSRDALRILVPSAAAYRSRAAAGTGSTSFVPPDWASDPAARLPADLDDRHPCRLALAAALPRVRSWLEELAGEAQHALVVAAPGEPLASGCFLPLVTAVRESGLSAHALLGLEAADVGSSADPPRAARAMACLAGVDAELGARPDALGDVLLIGTGSLPGSSVLEAATEVAAWWTARVAEEGPLGRGAAPPAWRGRAVCYRAARAGTAALDVGSRVEAETSRVAHDAARLLLEARPTPESLSTRSQIDRMAEEVRQVVRPPSAEDVAAAQDRGSAQGPPSRRRLEAALQALQSEAEAERDELRAFLFGGSIQRLSGRVARGWLSKQLAWTWDLLLQGHVGLETAVAWVNGLALALPTQGLDEWKGRLARQLEEHLALSERRRAEGAPAAVFASIHGHALRAARGLRRVEPALTALRELHGEAGEIAQALLAARAGLAELARRARPPEAPRQGPWRAAVPFPRGEAGGPDAQAWLAELAAGSPDDPGRGLGRGVDVLAASLREHVERAVTEQLRRQPIASLPGIADWSAEFAASLPPTTRQDERSWPPGWSVETTRVLFAGDRSPLPVGAAFPPATRSLPAHDATTLGWLDAVGPLPLAAFPELGRARACLGAAVRAGRLRPFADEVPRHQTTDAAQRAFHDPLPGDLGLRAAHEALRRKLLPKERLEADVLAPLASGDWAAARTALSRLAELPRDAPALRQAAILGGWARWDSLERLSALDRDAQDVAALPEPDGADAELLATCAATARAASPVKKALELSVATEQLVQLVAAADALTEAQRTAEASLAGGELLALRGLLTTWQGWVEDRKRELRGRSDLAVDLRTRRLVLAGTTRLLAEVTNRGQHPSLRGTLRLLASPAFRVVGADAFEVGRLGPGAAQVVELRIKPQRAGRLTVELELTWDDLEASGKRLAHAVEVELIDQPPPFRRIDRNPYIAGPPVRSESMFFGRDDVFRYVAENLAGRHQDNVLILHGQRRTGKSSILYQLERRDLLPEHVPVLVDLQGLGGFDTAGLLYQLARHASRRLKKRGGAGAHAPTPDREAFRELSYDAFQEHLDDLEDVLEAEGRRLLIMIDEFDVLQSFVESGKVEPEIFPFLRNLMQHREHVAFLLSGTHQLVEMKQDYWSVLFSLAASRRVSYLDAADARALVETPLEGEVIFDDLVVDTLLHLTAGHPYYLQLTCQNLVNHLNEHAQHACVRPEDLQAVVPAVLESGSGHFEHEWRTSGSAASRLALAAMAARDDTGLAWFEPEELARELAGIGPAPACEPEALRAALGGLADRDLVEASADRRAWRLRIDLMRRWIRQSHPLERAAAEEARS